MVGNRLKQPNYNYNLSHKNLIFRTGDEMVESSEIDAASWQTETRQQNSCRISRHRCLDCLSCCRWRTDDTAAESCRPSPIASGRIQWQLDGQTLEFYWSMVVAQNPILGAVTSSRWPVIGSLSWKVLWVMDCAASRHWTQLPVRDIGFTGDIFGVTYMAHAPGSRLSGKNFISLCCHLVNHFNINLSIWLWTDRRRSQLAIAG